MGAVLRGLLPHQLATPRSLRAIATLDGRSRWVSWSSGTEMSVGYVAESQSGRARSGRGPGCPWP